MGGGALSGRFATILTIEVAAFAIVCLCAALRRRPLVALAVLPVVGGESLRGHPYE